MPKRRRLLTPMKKKANIVKQNEERVYRAVSTTPRGRLKGALMYALDPVAEDSDTSLETPVKPDRTPNKNDRRSSDEEDPVSYSQSPVRQSYVLKLFDRSVDLSQFEEDSPLYPICRAWMINQPKGCYGRMGKTYNEPEPTEDSVDLPAPDGPPVSRIPDLLPIQQQHDKNNINLNYREAPPPSKEELLNSHLSRWASIRRSWLDQSTRVEARYEATQEVLNKLNASAL